MVCPLSSTLDQNTPLCMCVHVPRVRYIFNVITKPFSLLFSTLLLSSLLSPLLSSPLFPSQHNSNRRCNYQQVSPESIIGQTSKYIKCFNWPLNETCSVWLYLQKHIFSAKELGYWGNLVLYRVWADIMWYQAALHCLCPFSEMSPHWIQNGLSVCLPSFMLLSLPRFSHNLLNFSPDGPEGLLFAFQSYYVSFLISQLFIYLWDGVLSVR